MLIVRLRLRRLSAVHGGWRAGLAVLVAAAFALGAPAALAAPTPRTPTPLLGSQFQGGDGNQVDEAPWIDWEALEADGRVGHTRDPSGPNDNVFTNGSEINPGEWTVQNGRTANPAAGDILDFYDAVDRAPGGDVFVYLAFDRRDSGNGFLAFTLNQDDLLWHPHSGTEAVPCRRTGDISIGYTTTGGTPSINVYEWETTSTADNGCARTGHLVPAHLTAGVDWQAALNRTLIPANENFLPGHYAELPIPSERFGEAAIDLSKVVAVLPGEEDENCREFLSIWMNSRSSHPLTSNLNDYVAPHRVPIAVCPRRPGLTTTTQRPVALGQEIHDTARLSGGLDATGTLTFRLYGPGQRSCRGRPVFTYSMEVIGNSPPDYESGAFTVMRAGTYRWVVSYSGDVNNEPAGPTRCGDPAETVRVSRASPRLSSTASAAHVHLPQAILRIYDVAHLSAGFNPRG